MALEHLFHGIVSLRGGLHLSRRTETGIRHHGHHPVDTQWCAPCHFVSLRSHLLQGKECQKQDHSSDYDSACTCVPLHLTSLLLSISFIGSFQKKSVLEKNRNNY